MEEIVSNIYPPDNFVPEGVVTVVREEGILEIVEKKDVQKPFVVPPDVDFEKAIFINKASVSIDAKILNGAFAGFKELDGVEDRTDISTLPNYHLHKGGIFSDEISGIEPED